MFMAKNKNGKIESLKSLIPYSVENLSEAKEYSNNVLGVVERGLRKVGGGIKETANFYRDHPADVAGTATAAVATAYTGSELSKALGDYNFREFLPHGQVPRGGTILPYSNPYNVPHPPVIIPPEPITNNPMNVLGIILPFVIPLVTLGIEGARYYQWKKSINKIKAESKSL